MNKYFITEEQANIISRILMECQAKLSLPGLDILRSLVPYEEVEKEEEK